LFCGLRLGAEAIEKYLKAFILYGDASQDVRKYNHRIKDLAQVASRLELRFNASQFSPFIDRLETHYHQRYPDVHDFKRDASTGELVGIDELVLHICECLPIPEMPKLRDYGVFFFVCCPWIPPEDPRKRWLEPKNLALQRVKPALVKRYHAIAEPLGEAQKVAPTPPSAPQA
jgi:hypothetical protein